MLFDTSLLIIVVGITHFITSKRCLTFISKLLLSYSFGFPIDCILNSSSHIFELLLDAFELTICNVWCLHRFYIISKNSTLKEVAFY